MPIENKEIIWSKYQEAIFEDAKNGNGHLVIEARAGSSKTTVLLESLHYFPRKYSCLLTAFNKSIADELKLRAPENHNGHIATFHSLGLKAVSARFPGVEVNNQKIFTIIDNVVGKDKKLWELKSQVRQCVALCKATLSSSNQEIKEVIDEYGIDVDIDEDKFVSYVSKTMLKCFEKTKEVDFNDMTWFTHVHDLVLPKYDIVLVDECQDLDKVQINIALNSVKENGRIIVLGDKNQCLYRFKASTSEIFDILIKEYNAKTLPLPISYRCPTSVIKEAKRLVPDIQVWEKANPGLVKNISELEMKKIIKTGNIILSRVNAPLVPLALYFIGSGQPANVLGKDIGMNLINLIKKSKKKTIASLLTWLTTWSKKEVARLHKNNKENAISIVEDKVACIEVLAESVSSIADLKKKIENLFKDTEDDKIIRLGSIHKFKGKECKCVFLLKKTLKYYNQDEKNCVYVGITRSQDELYYVT